MDFIYETWFNSPHLLLTGASLAIIIVAQLQWRIKFSQTVVINYLICLLTGPLMVSTQLRVTKERWSNFPLFVLLFDFAYYGAHRCFHGFKVHWRHHKPLDNALQCLDFHSLEFLSALLIIFASSRVFAIPVAACMLFLLFYFILQMLLHSGKKYQWPILISPADHNIHHTKHRYNFGSIFKMTDRLFGTYHGPPGGKS